MNYKDKLTNFYLFKLITGIWLLGPLMMVFLAQYTGSYTKAGLAYGITFLTQSLFEIPTSILSDKHNRKYVLLLSCIIFFIANCLWTISCLSNYTLPIYIGCFLSGISAALGSGTDKALLYEYLKEDKKQNDYNFYCSKYHKYNQFGMILGLLLGIVVLRYKDISNIVYVSCFFAFLRIIFISLMPKQKNIVNSNLSNLNHFISAVKKIKKKKKLQKMGVIAVLDYVAIQTSHRFEGIYFATIFSDAMVVVVRLFKHFCGCISFSLVNYFTKYSGVEILLKSNLYTFIVKLIGWLAASPFIISASHLFYGGTESQKDKILQDLYSNKERATLDSILSFVKTLFGSMVLFFAGYLSDVFGTRFVMLLFITLNFIVWIAYKIYFKNSKPYKRQ